MKFYFLNHKRYFTMSVKNYKFLNRRIAVASILLMFGLAPQSKAQVNKLRVLFLGNSFTAANFLPTVFTDAAKSVGDTVIFDFNAPGGFTLQDHFDDVTSTAKIAVGNWNYVVLQEQSQRPSFPDADVLKDVYPYAKKLDSIVHEKNKCGRSVFFQTWGYRDGDPDNCPTWPPVCTYDGMDSMLNLRYTQMASDNNALRSPVGLVFKQLRLTRPALDLYAPDGRHPSEAGTYAAAITFYTILFAKDPTKITYNYTLPPAEADFIRQTVLLNVYNALLKYNVGAYDPKANFSNTIVSKTVTFNSAASSNVINYNWDFGDGGTSTIANPVHTYASAGAYTVRLIGDNCLVKDTFTQMVTITGSGIVHESSLLNSVSLYPNPASTILYLKSNLSLKNLSVELSSLLGQKIMNIEDYKGQGINIESLSSGIYLVQLKDNTSGATLVHKLIKE